jgi:DNA repair exonuclease SbcCD nuclease subunit
MPVRILFLADTHLGFDLPVAPRVARRRRGHDFLANYRRALEPAFAGEVDAVVHGGDVFHAPRVPQTLAIQAYDPLRALAERGVPVFLVPGNHERARLPHPRFALHPGIGVFDVPRSFGIAVRGVRVTLLGFPYVRRDVRERFGDLVAATGWRPGGEDIALLCIHHCFEGAKVGPQNFTFRDAPDVIRGGDIPAGVAAVLTGHVHRHQVLARDLAGRPLRAPVLYPGSTERTAFAEMNEDKGFLVLDLATDGVLRPGGRLERWEFRRLPARPMSVVDLEAGGASGSVLARRLDAALCEAPPDAVLRLRVHGRVAEGAAAVFGAERLRSVAPPDMNVEVVFTEHPRGGRGASGGVPGDLRSRRRRIHGAPCPRSGS